MTCALPPTPERRRILVVEDEAGIAETIEYALASDGFEPILCATAQAALQEFARAAPVLAILDVGLPDLSGFELLRRLREQPGAQAVPMLFLSARSDEIDRVAGLEMGADDYIPKPFSPRELVARVRAVLRRSERNTTTTPAAATADATTVAPLRHGALECDPERRRIRFHGQVLELSRYEYGLLACLLRRPGRVYTRDELLEQVWDDPAASFDRTVDAHIKTLRAKLRAVHAQADPIRTVRGVGYALQEPGA